MSTFRRNFGISTLVLGGAMTVNCCAFAQANELPSTTQSTPASAMNPSDPATYATSHPLSGQSKEGFWGKINPFARKKWVAREIDPVKDRTNELDQLQAKNASDIRSVDARSQAGIANALTAANMADSHAADASRRASAAQEAATSAGLRTDALDGTVSGLDQYQEIASSAVPFAAGRTALGTKGKADLDAMAAKLTGEKGYIVEVQGYSRGGVQTSQAMADSVVRYLVTEHQVPIYRIYRTGLGKVTASQTDNDAALVNGVRVTILHNSLAAMSGPTASLAPQTSTQTSNDSMQTNR